MLREGEGHETDHVGICVRCGACSCCARSEAAMAAPCPGMNQEDRIAAEVEHGFPNLCGDDR